MKSITENNLTDVMSDIAQASMSMQDAEEKIAELLMEYSEESLRDLFVRIAQVNREIDKTIKKLSKTRKKLKKQLKLAYSEDTTIEDAIAYQYEDEAQGDMQEYYEWQREHKKEEQEDTSIYESSDEMYEEYVNKEEAIKETDRIEEENKKINELNANEHKETVKRKNTHLVEKKAKERKGEDIAEYLLPVDLTYKCTSKFDVKMRMLKDKSVIVKKGSIINLSNTVDICELGSELADLRLNLVQLNKAVVENIEGYRGRKLVLQEDIAFDAIRIAKKFILGRRLKEMDNLVPVMIGEETLENYLKAKTK